MIIVIVQYNASVCKSRTLLHRSPCMLHKPYEAFPRYTFTDGRETHRGTKCCLCWFSPHIPRYHQLLHCVLRHKHVHRIFHRGVFLLEEELFHQIYRLYKTGYCVILQVSIGHKSTIIDESMKVFQNPLFSLSNYNGSNYLNFTKKIAKNDPLSVLQKKKYIYSEHITLYKSHRLNSGPR